jgi:hypothetical protein
MGALAIAAAIIVPTGSARAAEIAEAISEHRYLS